MTDVIVAAVVVIGVLAVVAAVIPALLSTRHPAYRAKCANNLEQIGRALAAYYGQYDDYYPFIDSAYATDSLTLVYPDFTANVEVFQCPEVEHPAEISVQFAGVHDAPDAERAHTWFGTATTRALKAPGWSSYGYDDCVDHQHAGANHVVAGDMDASFASDRGRTSNHRDGGNFLRFDGHVSFETTVYCSNNPVDNIFAAQPARSVHWRSWLPETDSWLRRP